uniref:Rab-GAP TBC domain-containing protein n=1 Tax=Arcella intermedia TaxID=1963864 RepID=A0A6B2L789_9EUKA
MSRNEWEYSYSTDGVVTEPDKIKATIFWGGVESSIRKDVWKYLLDFYKWDSTSVSREKTRETMRDVYGELKQKWINRMKEECKLQFQQQGFDHSSIPIGFEPPTNPRQFVATVIGSASATRLDHSSPAGGISEFEKNVMTTYGFRELCQVVAHDVRRTDRESPLFKEDEGPGLTKLSNVLMTYSYNCSVVNGYAQGMNDLAATILHVIDDEAQSFWCFKGLMDKVHNQFKTMCLPHLKAVAKLVQMVDPYLCSYFEKIEASDMLFLFQSILLCFKRDFETEQVKRLWEIFWTDQLTPHFHLFFTLAVVLDSRNEILEQEMDSQDLLMYFKSMNKHNTNIEDCLVLATRLWLYFEKNATASQKNDIFEKL